MTDGTIAGRPRPAQRPQPVCLSPSSSANRYVRGQSTPRAPCTSKAEAAAPAPPHSPDENREVGKWSSRPLHEGFVGLVEVVGEGDYGEDTCHEARHGRGEHEAVGEERGYPLADAERSEEHTSELQSRQYLVCRLLLEKKKKYQ